MGNIIANEPYSINKRENADLTLNSSKVKFTKQTPHQGSIGKSTGCVGKSSLAIDLFSFHMIFWMTQKRH